MQKSESIKELATSLAKFQGTLEAAKKDAANPFFKSKYADLASVIDAVRKPLSENGLSFMQMPATDETGKLSLTTIILHTSGEWISESYSMTPADTKPQTVGSCISYMRRYGLQSALGVATEDDDGNAASDTKPATSPKSVKKSASSTSAPKMTFDRAVEALWKLQTIDSLIEADEKIQASDNYTEEEKKQLSTVIKGRVAKMEADAEFLPK